MHPHLPASLVHEALVAQTTLARQLAKETTARLARVLDRVKARLSGELLFLPFLYRPLCRLLLASTPARRLTPNCFSFSQTPKPASSAASSSHQRRSSPTSRTTCPRARSLRPTHSPSRSGARSAPRVRRRSRSSMFARPCARGGTNGVRFPFLPSSSSRWLFVCVVFWWR